MSVEFQIFCEIADPKITEKPISYKREIYLSLHGTLIGPPMFRRSNVLSIQGLTYVMQAHFLHTSFTENLLYSLSVSGKKCSRIFSTRWLSLQVISCYHSNICERATERISTESSCDRQWFASLYWMLLPHKLYIASKKQKLLRRALKYVQTIGNVQIKQRYEIIFQILSSNNFQNTSQIHHPHKEKSVANSMIDLKLHKIS